MAWQSDPIDLMMWLLNTLHAKLKKGKTSIVNSTFQVCQVAIGGD